VVEPTDAGRAAYICVLSTMYCSGMPTHLRVCLLGIAAHWFDSMPPMTELQEIGILKSISYDKNIVQFYGASMVNREPMLLLEFCEGGDLRSVRQNPIH
jgi:Protein tyrosine and serine/threonine kinase